MSKTNWSVDVAHSTIEFSVRHMMIAKVKGLFHQFEADITADPQDLTTADIAFRIDLNSIDTRNNDRDNHLRSADFFEVDKYGSLTFKATSISRVSGNVYNITGDVTLHGVTRVETFEAEMLGTATDPWGAEKVGFTAKGVLKRSDYGLTYNAALETGGVLIGDDVNVSIEIEAAKG
ncbi:YceI family protein [Paenibacillus yanchengensis]|uniref:YceI family protein n=1 Tax=Paenibacillus yanchengensis TaxID=2035833 RepID=A0ABW4YP38_9BACL